MTEQINEVELIRNVFSNQAGEELLDYWDDVYMNRCSYHPDNTPEQTAFSEGLRSFVLAIHSLLNKD